MASLVRASTSLRNAGRAVPTRSIAAFHTSPARLVLSEDHPKEESHKESIDQHKADSIEKAKTGRGEWKPELASQSEQITQAGKHNMTMEEMQKMGKEKGEKESKGTK